MRTFYWLIIVIPSLLWLLVSCNGEKESNDSPESSSPRIVKSSSLNLPKRNSLKRVGDSIAFDVQSRNPIDSILLDYFGERSVYTESSFSWVANEARTGNQRIRLTVHVNGQVETHYARIKFVARKKPDAFNYEVIQTHPHDATAYTQGLFFIGDTLVESTGRKGSSRLSKLNLETGKVYSTASLPAQYFGEGSTMWGNKIIQLTWTSKLGFVYDRFLNPTTTFNYSHEGWGITTLGDTLVISDGTEVLHFWDPRDFSEIGRLEVYDHESKVVDLNELEIIDGLIYANIFTKDVIVAIDPHSGEVVKTISLKGLENFTGSRQDEVLNGIAYLKATKQVYVTGKLWPNLFEIRFIPDN